MRATALLLLVLLSGCDELGYVNAPPRHLTVKTESLMDAETAQRVLSARFRQYLPSLFSSMKTERTSDGITFSFERGAPAARVVEYLVSNRGHLVAASADGRVWFTEQDVVDAQASPGLSDDNGLILTLAMPAAARVKRLSAESQSQGQLVRITFDEQLLASPKVHGAVSGRSLRISIKKQLNELSLIATVIRSGTLPDRVSIVRSDLPQ